MIEKRESGIELLRIVAAVSIVYNHFLNEAQNDIYNTKDIVYWFIRIPGISGVDIFMVIMGFFLCTTNFRTLGKTLNLIFQMIFYSVCLYLIFVILGLSDFSVIKLVHKFVVCSWFVTLYTVIYFISPYLNIVLNRLSFREWKWFLFFNLLFFSIWPMVLGILEHYGYYLDGWSTVGRGGNQGGFNIVTYILMYCIGAFIRLQQIENKVKIKSLIIILTIIWILSMIIKMIPIHSSPWHIIGYYDNIFVISFAAIAFILFKKMSFRSRFINSLAKSAFAIYLVHPAFFRFINTSEILMMPLMYSLLYIIAFVTGISFVAYILFQIFNFIFKKELKKLDKIKIPYFD